MKELLICLALLAAVPLAAGETVSANPMLHAQGTGGGRGVDRTPVGLGEVRG